MMPTPSHLVGCIDRKDGAIDEEPLEADVLCPCGCKTFNLLYPGQTKEHKGELIPVVAAIEDKFFFLIRARCSQCDREHLLIDADFHGWNGLVCHSPEQASLPRPPLVHWECLDCAKTDHLARIWIQTAGEDDFIDESEGDVDASLWPDGFSWFSMSIECANCSKQTSEWVSYETM